LDYSTDSSIDSENDLKARREGDSVTLQVKGIMMFVTCGIRRRRC